MTDPSQSAAERERFEAFAAANEFNIDRDESDKYREYHRATTRWLWMGWMERARIAALAAQPQAEPSSATVPSGADLFALAKQCAGSTHALNCVTLNADDFGRLAAVLALAAPAVPELTTCNCRWNGDECVQQCTLHAAWKDTLHEYADELRALRPAAQSADAVDAVDARLRDVWLTAPKRVWLDIGEPNMRELGDNDDGQTFRDLKEVTWSDDNASGWGIPYVRADLAAISQSAAAAKAEPAED